MAMTLGIIGGILVGKIPLPGRSASLFLFCSVHLPIPVYYCYWSYQFLPQAHLSIRPNWPASDSRSALVASWRGVRVEDYRVPFYLNKEAAKPLTLCQLCSFAGPSSAPSNQSSLSTRCGENEPLNFIGLVHQVSARIAVRQLIFNSWPSYPLRPQEKTDEAL